MIHFKLITPERVVLEKDADSITLPTQTGEITVLSHHLPLISNLVAGEIRLKTGNEEEVFAVSNGVIEVKPDNQLVVLADTAEFGHEVDLERAEQAREKAQKLMQESYKDEKVFADAAASLEKHLARLKVARKHKSRKRANIET
ncbi:MAG: ATP synthase F1 subunit epsilon [Candidatus Doudnabacteria bacterium]|nr:ATP synthase F1 subunit epsilon [Candidatus Doudnabacteria bacterium]